MTPLEFVRDTFLLLFLLSILGLYIYAALNLRRWMMRWLDKKL